MKRKRIILSMLTMAAVMLFITCRHDAGDLPGGGGNTGPGGGGSGTGGGSLPPCDSTKIYFQQQVLPMLVSNCALSGCHDAASHQDGVVLISYESVMSTADVRPGNPGGSDLYEVLIENDPSKRMPPPPRNPLSQQQVRLVYDWIRQGAQNLVCQSLCDSSQFTYSLSIKTLVQNKCQGCHSGTVPQGGIDLSTYAGLKARVDDGRLWGAINHAAGFSPMPKNGTKLSDCEISQVRKWIENGAPNN